MYQAALYTQDGYRPGDSLNMTLGIRYAGFDIVVPQLQLNYRNMQRDSGDIADRVSTGGTLLYISPGVIAINDQVSMYVFVQVPLYQDLNGVQLVPRLIPTVGMEYAF